MGKGKGKKKNKNQFLGDLSAKSEAAVSKQEEEQDGEAKLSRKQKRELKLAKKAAANKQAEQVDDEDAAPVEDEADPPKPAAGGFAALNASESEEEDDESEDEAEDTTTTKVQSAFSALALGSEDEEEEEEASEDELTQKKKKKEKKEKKAKKEKKQKKSKKIEGEEDADEAEGPALSPSPTSKKKLSSKERRRLKEEKEKAQREAEYAKLSAPTDFAVSATSYAKDDAWLNATDINIPSFTISAHGKTLFQNAELKIAHGRKYGLIGKNGGGKSTLLKQIAAGELEIPPKIDCLYVEQEVTADDTPAVDMVLQADTKRMTLLAREKEILDLFEKDDSDEMSPERQEELQNELKQVSDDLRASGSDSAESRALALLNGLGFTPEMQRAPTKSFSGGWRMRVSLARALFMEPTLLFLDEPTNHLDLNAVIWLDDYLQKWKNTLLVVSHDQDFLDSVCTDIIHLDQQKLFYYRGNYEQFKGQHELTKEKLRKDYERQERELRAMKKKGQSGKKAKEQLQKKSKREGGGARKKGKSGKQDADNNDASLAERQLLQRPKDYEVKFIFPQPTELTPPIIQVDDVSFGYPGQKSLFKKLSFGIDMDSRITIVGNNGVGKSTLLKVVTQELTPKKGDVRINRHLRIARYHQHFLDILPPDETPVEFLRREHNCQMQEARNRLGRFGLEGSAHTIKMMNCSGGQKARVVFTSISFQNPHILIFDEPSNNLDLESIEALCDAINDFEGGVVLVTHDARLIQTTDCRLWVLQDRTVEEWEEGFDAYRDAILEELAEKEEEQRKKQNEKNEKARKAREEKMKALETRVKAAKLKKQQSSSG